MNWTKERPTKPGFYFRHVIARAPDYWAGVSTMGGGAAVGWDCGTTGGVKDATRLTTMLRMTRSAKIAITICIRRWARCLDRLAMLHSTPLLWTAARIIP